MLLSTFHLTVIVVLAIQLFYYVLFFIATPKRRKKDRSVQPSIATSILIYVKNKAEELKKNLPFFIEQQHDNFEIVLVDHSSTDNSLEVIESFQQKHTNIKVVKVENKENFWGNKKYALTLAIKAAAHQCILISDINTKPTSKLWIDHMTKDISNIKTIVIGHQTSSVKKYTFSHLFISFFNVINTIKTFTTLKLGFPHKASSTNFAFLKEEFFKVKGFISHIDIPHGECDLFLKEAATSKNTVFSIDNNSFVNNEQLNTLALFFKEQKKQANLFAHYSLKSRFLIAFFNFSKVLYYLLISFLFFLNWKIALLALLLYFIIQYSFTGKTISLLKEKKVFYFLPILDILYAITLIGSFITNRFNTSVENR